MNTIHPDKKYHLVIPKAKKRFFVALGVVFGLFLIFLLTKYNVLADHNAYCYPDASMVFYHCGGAKIADGDPCCQDHQGAGSICYLQTDLGYAKTGYCTSPSPITPPPPPPPSGSPTMVLETQTPAPTPPPGAAQCVKLPGYNGKIKFTFVGGNFKDGPELGIFISDYVENYLKKTAPFSTYSDKFTFSYADQTIAVSQNEYIQYPVTKTTIGGKDYFSYAPSEQLVYKIKQAAKPCKYDKLIFLDKNWPIDGLEGSFDVNKSFKFPKSIINFFLGKSLGVTTTEVYSKADPAGLMHQLGHIICGLVDERGGSNYQDTPLPINCDDPSNSCVNKFQAYGIKGCYKTGCNLNNSYASSSPSSIMTGGPSQTNKFNLISCSGCLQYLKQGRITPTGLLGKGLSIGAIVGGGGVSPTMLISPTKQIINELNVPIPGEDKVREVASALKIDILGDKTAKNILECKNYSQGSFEDW